MQTNGYFKNLEKYWSANFLALLASVNFVLAVIGAFITLIYQIAAITTISNFFKGIIDFCGGIIIYSITLFPISCFLAACISIFYIFLIVSKKRLLIILSMVCILLFWSVFFVKCYSFFNMNTGGAIFLAFIVFGNILVVPLSIAIYSILLIIEKEDKIRIPVAPLTQNNIFKIFVKIFYWYYLVLVGFMAIMGLYILST